MSTHEEPNEAVLFRCYLDARSDPDLSEAEREAELAEIVRCIDWLRSVRGLGEDPTTEDLLAHYDGAPPVPVEELERRYPDAEVTEAVRFEQVGGRTRVFPMRVVRRPGETLWFLPEPSAQEPRWRRHGR